MLLVAFLDIWFPLGFNEFETLHSAQSIILEIPEPSYGHVKCNPGRTKYRKTFATQMKYTFCYFSLYTYCL